jgi:hypothetical protein
MARKVVNLAGGSLRGKTVAVSASPSSRIPMTCAKRRRSRW